MNTWWRDLRQHIVQKLFCTLSGQTICAFAIASAILILASDRGTVARSRQSSSDSVNGRIGDLEKRGLLSQIQFIRPSAFGITGFQIGDYATYHYSRVPDAPQLSMVAPPTVTVDVVGVLDAAHPLHRALPAGSGIKHWLRFQGYAGWREHPGDEYRLVSLNDLRITAHTPSWSFVPGYFPIRDTAGQRWTDTEVADLDYEDHEVIEINGQAMPCSRYRVVLPGNSVAFQVWVNLEVRPLGIVRAKSTTDEILIENWGTRPISELSRSMAHIINGRSTISSGCLSCHGNTCHESREPPE